MPNKFRVNLIVLAAVLLPLLALSMQAFGQANATLGGTVSDTSQAVLPGATVKAVHGETGVVTTTTTNNAGIYNFPSLQPGTYQITATMQGFQTSSRTDVKLGLGSQSRLNFELVVAGVSTEVEVSTSAENLVLESGSSTGTVLQEEAVAELPLVSNDVMDLINIMGGVVKAENPIFSNSEQTFAGVPGGNINISRDGISVNEIRYSSGIVSPSRINTEMVGEFKMILSPVDAEMGRGAGQVQMITKSGANAFHGSGVWNIQNTALDANEFDNKDQTIVTEPAWRNLNNYTISASGPIIKNKTFFFATWDQQIVRSKSSVAPTSLTPCARKGIFRYFPGFQNGNALQDPQPVNSWFPSVDEAGNPVSPNGVAQLQYKSVLGTLTPTAVAQLADPDHGFMTDCAAYDFLGLANNGIQVPWDPNFRNGYDTTGYVTNFTNAMPPVNYYGTGDGLNTGGHLWTRMLKGSDTVFGSGEDNQRKSITVKIDHNISSAHRVSGTYSYETDNGEDAYRVWPQEYGGYGGLVDRQPQTFTSTLTSTLKPTLLNEFRVGLSRTRTHTNEPLSNPETGADLAQVLLGLVPNQATLFPNYADPLIIGPGSDSAAFHGGINHPYGARGNMPATWGGSDPRWTFSDTITWMKGAHSFKGGFEYRTNKSWQESNGQITFFYGGNTFPSLRGGTNWNYSPIPDWNSNTGPNWDADGVIGTPGANATQNYPMVNGMMNYMTGTVGTASQYFFTTDLNNPKWNDPTTDQFYETDLRNREISFFFKDDWKLNNSLTLNLGMRYEYYGVPWVDNGMAAGVVGNYAGMFGVSGGDLNTWMPANPDPTIGTLTQQIYIGPNSPNPDIPAFNKDSNNFAPHVGFAWQLPWFGKGKTTLRGGYSVSYTAVGNFDSFGGYGAVLSNNAGSSYVYNYTGDAVNPIWI
jgi:hypothetical protein